MKRKSIALDVIQTLSIINILLFLKDNSKELNNASWYGLASITFFFIILLWRVKH